MAELVLLTLRNFYSSQASTECPDEDIIIASGHALVALTRLLLAAHAESPPARRGAILERIINYGESALATFATRSIQASVRADLLHDLGNAYGFRSQLGKNGMVREDLDRAVELCGQAVNAVDPGHPNREKWLSWFVQWSQGRAHLNGEDEDHFNRNIQTSLEVEAAAAQPGFARAASLAMVGDTHYARYLKSQKGDDLDRAIQLFEQAASHSDRDTMQPNALRNFSFCLLERFDQAKDIRDLDRAFEACQNLHPQGALLPNSPEQYEATIVMAVLWERRYKYTGAAADLEKFCEAADNATAIAPLTDARHLLAPILHNLGGILVSQFELTNQVVYLDRAIELDREALAISPDADPSRAAYLASLGDRLVRRSRETGSDETAEALALYENANRCVNARTSTRIAAAAAAAGIHSHQSSWEPASQHLEKAVDLLRSINPRSLKHKDKQSALRDFPGLSSDAAAAALNAGRGAEHALRLLELGRGLIAGMMLEMRGDVSDLSSRYPDLAQEFLSLREQLDISDEENRTKDIHHMAGRGSLVEGGSDSPFRWEALAQQRLDASRKLDRLLDKIRTRPGFEGFLLPPSVQQMTAAASDGPIVVVNISRFRCDAFLITRPKGITVTKLPNLTRRRIDQEAERLQKSVGFHMAPALEWLWDDICCPVLDALGLDGTTSQGETLGRIWWVPTGLLSQLPLHAAGRYKQGGKDTVMDRIMSTYASSVKALIHGRGNGAHHATEAEFCREGDAVLVAMAETPDKGGLAFAKQELDTVKGLCSSLRLNPITPELKKEDVLRRLNGCRVFHFAGHGRSHPNDPSQSCLLLHDWRTNPLTVSDLRDNKLQENPPFLAYLSACSTGQVQVKSLVDEGIHLVGSFQLAGFRHVIGTLWEVSDAHCVAVARMFYETIAAEGISDIAVCRGLHRATKALRDGQLHVEVEERKATLSSVGTQKPVMGNQYWTPYIHYGV
ncbi:CHAT domain containing protein [Rhypophila decipiens]